MIFTCPSVTQEILRTMAQRVELVQTVSQEQAKLISLGTLATELAHELNNPAAAVSQIGHTVCILVLLLLRILWDGINVFSVMWAWIGVTFYATRFETDDNNYSKIHKQACML
jgi:signal transduction histidine kinase